MKKLCIATIFAFFCTALYATETPFDEKDSNQISQPFVDEDGSVFADEDFNAGEAKKNQHNDKMMYLDSVQKHFWNPKRKPQDNTFNIIHRDGDTHKIRTRYAMTTTIVFDNDKIAQVIFGDPQGFELKELGKDKWDLSNILTIRPKMIGIDTNLTVIGESGTIYTFYIFSTHFTNRRDPAFTVFVSKERSISKIAMTNLEEDRPKSRSGGQKNIYQRIEYDAIEEDNGEYITIGDRVNKIHIEKNKIKQGYFQAPKSTRDWKTLWLKKEHNPIALRMMAIDIFNDNEYTYFKFDREDALSKFPALFKVVDGYDNPVNIKIVGNYIIAEDLSNQWTLKMGDEWVCVRRSEKPIFIQEKGQNLDVETIHAKVPPITKNPPKPKQQGNTKKVNTPKAKNTAAPQPANQVTNSPTKQQTETQTQKKKEIQNKLEEKKANLKELEAKQKATNSSTTQQKVEK